MQNRVLSELLVEHVEPGHVRRIQSTRHHRFHCRLALYWPRAALRTPARLFPHVRRGGAPHDALIAPASQAAPMASTAAARPSREGESALALDRKKLAAFSALGGRFLGAATERARALAMPAGTRAQALQPRANSSGVAPASPRAAYRALLERALSRKPANIHARLGAVAQLCAAHSRAAFA